MRSFMKKFCKRGLMGAWGGPAVLAIVWLALQKANVISEVSVNEAVRGVLSSIVLAFIATGISAIYQEETLPRALQTLTHIFVLYLDYLLVYLLNGWLISKYVIIFTAAFVIGYMILWAVIYFTISGKVKKMNTAIDRQ